MCVGVGVGVCMCMCVGVGVGVMFMFMFTIIYRLFICSFVHLFICSSIYLFIYLSIYLFIYLSIKENQQQIILIFEIISTFIKVINAIFASSIDLVNALKGLVGTLQRMQSHR